MHPTIDPNTTRESSNRSRSNTLRLVGVGAHSLHAGKTASTTSGVDKVRRPSRHHRPPPAKHQAIPPQLRAMPAEFAGRARGQIGPAQSSLKSATRKRPRSTSKATVQSGPPSNVPAWLRGRQVPRGSAPPRAGGETRVHTQRPFADPQQADARRNQPVQAAGAMRLPSGASSR